MELADLRGFTVVHSYPVTFWHDFNRYINKLVFEAVRGVRWSCDAGRCWGGEALRNWTDDAVRWWCGLVVPWSFTSWQHLWSYQDCYQTCDSWQLYSAAPLWYQPAQHHDLISHSVTLSWHWANQYLPYPNNAENLAKKRQVGVKRWGEIVMWGCEVVRL